MPKVLRIINRFNLGGPTYNAAYLTTLLAPEFDTMLIGGPNEASEGSSLHITDKLGIKPHILGNMQRSVHPANDWYSYREIKKLIREFRPDIVHTHASKAGAVGRLAALHCKVPVIVHTFHGHVFHSYFGKFKTGIYKQMERYLASQSQSIIAISEGQKKELSEIHRICPAEKITVIPLGFDLEVFRAAKEEKRKAFRDQYRIADDEIAIGIVGRLVPIKNHGMFVEALDHVLRNTNKKVKAFIIGDGEEKEKIMEQARSKQIKFSLTPDQGVQLVFTSWIKDVDRAMAGLDIIALTSLNEGTPVSLIEAQAAGKPIISTAVGGISDIVLPGKTALLCASNETGKFSEQLLELIEKESLRTEMAVNGWEFVNERFGLTRLRRDMSGHYQHLLNQKIR